MNLHRVIIAFMFIDDDLSSYFLLSLPALDGHPCYEGALMYIYEHNDSGIKALTLNKPAQSSLQQVIKTCLPKNTIAVINDAPVLSGGPSKDDEVFVCSYDDDQKQYTVNSSPDLLLDIATGNGPLVSHVFTGICQWTLKRFFEEYRRNYWLISKVSLSTIMSAPLEERYDLVMSTLGEVNSFKMMSFCAEA